MKLIRTMTAALAASAMFALAACGDGGESASPASGPDKVTVGVIPIVDVAPIYLGDQQGFFAEQNIDLALESGQGGAAIIPAVASGQFQFGFSNVTSLVLATSRGLPLKITTNGSSSTGKVGADSSAVIVPKGSPVTKPSELEGKKVAVNTLNNIGTNTISKVVRDDGGDPTKIEFVELGFPDMPAALANKQVDAIWTAEPFVTIALQQGGTAIAWPFVETSPDLMIATYFTSARLAAENPDLVKRFTTAMNKSMDFAQANPDQARAILGTYTKIDQATIDKLNLPNFTSKINPASVDLLADLAVTDGMLTEKPDVTALLP